MSGLGNLSGDVRPGERLYTEEEAWAGILQGLTLLGVEYEGPVFETAPEPTVGTEAA